MSKVNNEPPEKKRSEKTQQIVDMSTPMVHIDYMTMTALDRDKRVGPDLVDGICKGVVFSVLHYDGYSLIWPSSTKYNSKQRDLLLPTLAQTFKGKILGSVVKFLH